MSTENTHVGLSASMVERDEASMRGENLQTIMEKRHVQRSGSPSFVEGQKAWQTRSTERRISSFICRRIFRCFCLLQVRSHVFRIC